MNDPTCTIIMPAYNAARHIGEAIASVVAQDFAAWRLVVVDDGSTDGTAEVALRRGDARLTLISQPNQGVSNARNRGLAEATGEFVAFLDADDRWRPDALSRLIAALRARPEAALAYGEAATIDDAGTLLHDGGAPMFRKRPQGGVLGEIARRNFLLPGAVCVRRSAVARAGTFNPALPPREDWEFFCRIAAEGDFVHVPAPAVLEYRLHAGGASHARAGAIEKAMLAVETIFANPAIRARLGSDAKAARRDAEAGVFSLIANDRLREADWRAARTLLRRSLARNPSELREWILFACACAHFMPQAIRRRLK